MTTLFSTSFEDGLLYHPTSGFGGIVVTGGTMDCNATSKHDGNYGCEISPLVGYKTVGYKYVGGLTRLRQAFWLDPNSMVFTDTRYLILCRNYHSDLSDMVYSLYFSYTNPNYQLQIAVYNNVGGAAYGTPATIPDGFGLVEIDWVSGVNGYAQLWIDGVNAGATAVVDNSNLRVKYASLGVCSNPAYAIAGSFYVDSWRANDDGSLIGA